MADFEDMQANETIGYWLFYAQRCVAYAFAEMMQAYCEEQEKPVVTPPQWGVLALLFHEDGQTIGAISQQRGIDAPTVTGIVKRLELSELVERRHSKEDRRVVKVYLTDAGHDITQALYPKVQTFNNAMLCDFPEDERQHFLCMLQRIIANLSDEVSGTGDRFNRLPIHAVRQDFVYNDLPQKRMSLHNKKHKSNEVKDG